MNCEFSSVDFSFTFLCECEFIKINLTKVKFKGTSIVDPKIENIILKELARRAKAERLNVFIEEDFKK